MYREILESEKAGFDQVATHPLQSWAWGEFRQQMGKKVIRLGEFIGKTIKSGWQMTVHPIPKTGYCVGYLPRTDLPTAETIHALSVLALREKLAFIKLEPNKIATPKNAAAWQKVIDQSRYPIVLSPRPLFTNYSFQLNLAPTEADLLAKMHSKTRYNVRLAEKKGVEVKLDDSPEAVAAYLKLTDETTKRQQFFAHDSKYHETMWRTMHQAGIAHLIIARYQGVILTAWILFGLNGVAYYPYGASTREHREVMANNLVMWETIKWAKRQGYRTFDMWGSLGPNPDKNDPWYGFHRFKAGYGAELKEFIGSWELVINEPVYKLYNLADKVRWGYLRTKARLRGWYQ